jgi:hypothetical protein
MSVQVPPGFYNRANHYATVRTGHISVGATPTRILFQNDGRLGVVVTNAGADIVYVGAQNDVGASNGHVLFQGSSLSLDSSAELWGQAASGTQLVTFLEEQVR